MGALGPDAQLVLVIEDDDDTRLLLWQLLKEDGFDARGAGTIEEALPILERGGVSLVLLDHSPTCWHGSAVVDVWRSRARPPVIVVSGATDADGFAESMSAATVVHKPFDIDDLLARVHEYVAPAEVPSATR